MPGTPVFPKNSPPPLAPYSPGMQADGVLYVSGMLAMDENGKTVGTGDVRAQTRHVIEAIKATVAAAGGELSDICFNMIFLRDLADYAAMNEIYGQYFSEHRPARYCIRADLVRPEFLVEIASIAHVKPAAPAR